MAKSAYIGDTSSLAKKIKKMYVGDANGVARKVKKAYVGDANGVARLFYSGREQIEKYIAFTSETSGSHYYQIYSDKGITWSNKGVSFRTIHNYCVTYGNGHFLAWDVGYQSIYSSIDGSAWTQVSQVRTLISGYYFDGIYYDKYINKFLLVTHTTQTSTSPYTFTGRIYESEDGVTWTLRSTISNSTTSRYNYGGGYAKLYVSENAWTFINAHGAFISTDKRNFAKKLTLTGNSDGKAYYIVGNIYEDGVWSICYSYIQASGYVYRWYSRYSTNDGASWSSETELMNGSSYFERGGSCYGNGKRYYVLFGNAVYYSSNGTSFTRATNTPSIDGRNVLSYCNHKIFCSSHLNTVRMSYISESSLPSGAWTTITIPSYSSNYEGSNICIGVDGGQGDLE